jgi:peptide-methionine (S)-S-oxide reductase
VFDPAQCSYEQLCVKLFSTVPDPTALNRVGNDRGTQYRHGIYTHTAEQAAVAQHVLDAEQAKYSAPIVTEVKPAEVFYPAENYHQRYLQKGGQSASKDAKEKVRCYG